MKKLYLTLSLALTCLVTFAVPAKRGQWKMVKLADGTEVRVELRGDEFCHYWQAEDGSKFVKSSVTGVYERTDMETLLKSSEQLRASAQEQRAQRLSSTRAITGEPGSYTGQKKGLIVLVEFADMPFQESNTRDLFERIANERGFDEQGFTGSVKDYFYDQSYGTFELDFDVVGPVAMPNNYAYYGENVNGFTSNTRHLAEMIVDACEAVDDEVDFTQYDWDEDGQVDQIFILYAGRGEASGGDENTIWPHEWNLRDAMGQYQYMLNPPVFDGVRLYTYACGCEIGYEGTIDGIGTICHEFSHCLGLPDMYDTQGNGYGLDDWSLMGSGNYNNNSFTPAGYTSYERMLAGWKQPIELTENVTVDSMKAIGDNGNTYIIYNDGNRNEYYLLENRQKEGWDVGVPSSGLLILHVDYNPTVWQYNVVNSTVGQQQYGILNPHDRCAIVQADENGLINTPRGDVWPYGANRSFNKTSSPAATVYNSNTDGSNYLNKSVDNITKNADGTIKFTFSLDDATGIDNVTVNGAMTADGETRVYSLDGRYLGNDLDALDKGIYIVNGKKIVK